MTLKIYHNPRCSKSRETLTLLMDRGLRPQVIDYMKTPPTVAELGKILELFNQNPMAIIRTKESLYTELKLNAATLKRNELLQILHANPALLERPIVVNGDKAAIGRPPENVLSILD